MRTLSDDDIEAIAEKVADHLYRLLTAPAPKGKLPFNSIELAIAMKKGKKATEEYVWTHYE